MNRERVGYAIAALLALALLGYLAVATGLVAPYLPGYDPAEPDGYQHTTVTVVDADTGAERGRVTAAVADTFVKRYVGLSQTDRLPPDHGMLFVHDGVARRTYVMRNMSVGLDIVFADADGTITTIHTAPAPAPGSDGSDQQYQGRAKYVLEVNDGWAAEHGVEPGDTLAFNRTG